MSRAGNLGGRLARGEVSYDFVGRQKRWYLISAVVVIVAVVALFVRGLDFSIDFRGGAQFTVPSKTLSVSSAQSAAESVGVKNVSANSAVLLHGGREITVQTPPISNAQSDQIADKLAAAAGLHTNQVEATSIGADWGSQISDQALKGLIIFLCLVVLYMAIFFEWKMAVAGLVALLHDLVITIGVYALVGFQVSPATIVGVLTILGYSLYDTVVVFDKVRENTRSLATVGRYTYSEAANRAVNQTLVRSINTSAIALLPVLALLFAGFELNGAGEIQDLALALFVGIAAGTYSSIFIATPLLADLKEREAGMKALRHKILNKRAKRADDAVAAQATEAIEGASGTTRADGGVEDAVDETGDFAYDYDGEEDGALSGAGAGRAETPRRGPRPQPTRNKSRNRPSGKRKR
jgi:preprotein translocase subunit SecF